MLTLRRNLKPLWGITAIGPFEYESATIVIGVYPPDRTLQFPMELNKLCDLDAVRREARRTHGVELLRPAGATKTTAEIRRAWSTVIWRATHGAMGEPWPEGTDFCDGFDDSTNIDPNPSFRTRK